MPRNISRLRLLMKCAWGCVVGVVLCSTSCESTPNFESRIDNVKPTGPPPTITTGTSVVVGGDVDDE